MAGSGSPCGACKFLRRKCVRGCVFAPHFCHQQGAAHFAAIHKVFGASNASKLLAHLPAGDRPGAAITISYEAQARLKDPIYGCVSQIFALQQQVIHLQAQLALIKEQAGTQGLFNGCANPNERYMNGGHYDGHQLDQDMQSWFRTENVNTMPEYSPSNNLTIEASNMNVPCFENKPSNSNSAGSCENSAFAEENHAVYYNGRFDEACHFMSSLDSLQAVNSRQIAGFQDSNDLHSVPCSYSWLS